jgi:fructose-bisphosphate aldolase class II
MSKAQYWFDRALKEHFAIGAFNAASIETLKAVVSAAKNQKSPVMIEASHGEVTYFGARELVGVCRAMEQSYGVPILLNLDHAPDFEKCKEAIDFGFDYVHLDGSKMPIEENTMQTKKLVEYAHVKEVLVEGEIDNINVLGASSADHRHQSADEVRDRKYYTDPEKALKFVQETGVDTFASFVGNVHGLYSGKKNIDLALLRLIKEKLGDKFLSLHGGSGIPETDVREAVKNGIVKVNVNSELRVAFIDKLHEIMVEHNPASANGSGEAGEIAIYKLMPEAISAMQKIVEEKIKVFGSGNRI